MSRSGLSRGAGLFRLRPGDGVLKDAFRAGVVEELAAGDEALGHRYLAPGAEPVGQRGLGRLGGLRWLRGDLRHGLYCP